MSVLINCLGDLERKTWQVKRNLVNCIQASSQTVQNKVNHRRNSREILELIKRKNKVRKLWHKYREGADQKLLNSLVHKISDKMDEDKANA